MDFPTDIGAMITAETMDGVGSTFVYSGNGYWACADLLRHQSKLKIKSILHSVAPKEYQVGDVVRARYSLCQPRNYIFIGQDCWVTQRTMPGTSAVIFNTADLKFVGELLTKEPTKTGAVVMTKDNKLFFRIDHEYFSWMGFDDETQKPNAWNWDKLSKEEPELIFEGVC
jgi:hypothetical protein